MVTPFRFPTLRIEAAYLKDPLADRDAVTRTDASKDNCSNLVARRRRIT